MIEDSTKQKWVDSIAQALITIAKDVAIEEINRVFAATKPTDISLEAKRTVVVKTMKTLTKQMGKAAKKVVKVASKTMAKATKPKKLVNAKKKVVKKAEKKARKIAKKGKVTVGDMAPSTLAMLPNQMKAS